MLHLRLVGRRFFGEGVGEEEESPELLELVESLGAARHGLTVEGVSAAVTSIAVVARAGIPQESVDSRYMVPLCFCSNRKPAIHHEAV